MRTERELFALDKDCQVKDEVLLDLTGIIQLLVDELSKETPSIKSNEDY